MNLPSFLKAVDEAVDPLPREHLAEFIHKTALVLPEQMRDGFLARLKAAGSERGGQEGMEDCEGDWEGDLLPRLQAVERGKARLTGNLNEEYDDWYDDCEEEFLFEDPDRIGELMDRAAERIHTCVDQALYREGCALAERLFALRVQVDGEYGEYMGDTISISEMAMQNLTGFDFKRLQWETLYCAYFAHPMEERAEALYHWFEREEFRSVSFENVCSVGELDREQFLPLWMDYLGGIVSRKSEQLLAEAVALSGDRDGCLAAARRFCSEHPGLYVNCLEKARDGSDDPWLMAVGMEAAEQIDPKFRVRSCAALIGAEGALRLGQRDVAERLWLEAFRSDTRPIHYLRLAAECSDFSLFREEAGRIAGGAVLEHERTYAGLQPDDLRENTVTRNDRAMLAFLTGAFSDVLGLYLNEKKPLGWSCTFMKQGIAAFLIYLYEGDKPLPGISAMCAQVKSAIGFTLEQYDAGLVPSEEKTDRFWHCFRAWRDTVQMSEEERERVLHRIEDLIQNRVAGIMQANRRKQYGECAAFIAAIGEVRESRGEQNGKQRFMMDYKLQYSRRTAFHGELTALGMRDVRKR